MSEIRDITTLSEWELNKDLRRIKDSDYDRMLENLKFGQHSTLLIKPDGTVLGGNNRLRAMRELGYVEVECIVLTTGRDELGYYPILDGRTYKDINGIIPHHFHTEEELEIALAFSHNSNPAYYNDGEVANIMGNFPDIDWKMFDGSFVEPVSFGEVASKFTEEPNLTETEEFITCPNCAHRFSLKDKKGKEDDNQWNPQTPENLSEKLAQTDQEIALESEAQVLPTEQDLLPPIPPASNQSITSQEIQKAKEILQSAVPVGTPAPQLTEENREQMEEALLPLVQ